MEFIFNPKFKTHEQFNDFGIYYANVGTYNIVGCRNSYRYWDAQ